MWSVRYCGRDFTMRELEEIRVIIAAPEAVPGGDRRGGVPALQLAEARWRAEGHVL